MKKLVYFQPPTPYNPNSKEPLIKRVLQYSEHYRRIRDIHEKINEKAHVIEMENFDWLSLFSEKKKTK